MDLKLNDRVRVTSGSFMDQEGQVLGLRHKIVKVAIDSLGYILVAYIERSKLISVQSKWGRILFLQKLVTTLNPPDEDTLSFLHPGSRFVFPFMQFTKEGHL